MTGVLSFEEWAKRNLELIAAATALPYDALCRQNADALDAARYLAWWQWALQQEFSHPLFDNRSGCATNFHRGARPMRPFTVIRRNSRRLQRIARNMAAAGWPRWSIAQRLSMKPARLDAALDGSPLWGADTEKLRAAIAETERLAA